MLLFYLLIFSKSENTEIIDFDTENLRGIFDFEIKICTLLQKIGKF